MVTSLVHVASHFKEMESLVHVSNLSDIHNHAKTTCKYTIDPDPCASDPCDTNADCTRESLTTGSFDCVCRVGFTGTGFECSGTL